MYLDLYPLGDSSSDLVGVVGVESGSGSGRETSTVRSSVLVVLAFVVVVVVVVVAVKVRDGGSGDVDGLRDGVPPEEVLRTVGVESLLEVTFSIARLVSCIARAKSSSIRLVSASPAAPLWS